jgi:hypothetical protein
MYSVNAPIEIIGEIIRIFEINQSFCIDGLKFTIVHVPHCFDDYFQDAIDLLALDRHTNIFPFPTDNPLNEFSVNID